MIVFVTEIVSSGAGTVNPTAFVSITVVVHAPDPATYAVFDTAVVTHTGPTTPVIVNVHTDPRSNAIPPLVHWNGVPLPTLVTAGVGNPLGSDAVALVTTGEIVSITTRFVSVIVPVFVTTTRYVTGEPIPGAAGSCAFTTEIPVTGACTTIPTPLLLHTVVPHGVAAITYAVFDTAVFTHTTPTRPLIVNVVVVPGVNVSPVPPHVYSVAVPAAVTAGAAQPAGVTATWFTITGVTVSVTSRSVIVAPPVFVTMIEYPIG